MAQEPAARGRFITFEGGEGAGKTTQLRLLVDVLERAGIRTCATREPGGSPGAEAIRRLLLEGETERWDSISEALLLVAARRDHLTRLIEPALVKGVWIICDRFADSTLAYQGYGKGVPHHDLEALHRIALGQFVPDLTLILDVPVETGLVRAAQRHAALDRFERLDPGFHERLRQGFRRIADDHPERCVLIDAAAAPPTVHEAILVAVRQHLGVRLG